MRTMSKVVFFLLLPFIAQVLVSCCDCDNDYVFYHYTRSNMEIRAFDNYNTTPDFNVSDGVSRNTYGIRLTMTREDIASIEAPFNLFSSCYAFTCRCEETPVVLYSEEVEDFSFTTLLDFDADHPAGSDVSDLFVRFDGERYEAMNYFIDRLKKLNIVENYSIDFDLLLMHAPAQSQDVQFKVKMVLSDGRVFETETETVTLN